MLLPVTHKVYLDIKTNLETIRMSQSKHNVPKYNLNIV